MHKIFASALVIMSDLAIIVVALTMLWKRFYLSVALFFLLFNFGMRIASLSYIDIFGRFYSDQLQRLIGPGTATPIYVAAYLIVLVPIILLLSPSRLAAFHDDALRQPPQAQAFVTLGDLVFIVSLVFVFALYAEMISIGTIPLLVGMERYDYLAIAGPLHRFFVYYHFLVSFIWGMIVAFRWVHFGRLDLRYFLLVFLSLFYLFLCGHRFSAFYSLVSAFALPLAVCFLPKSKRALRFKHHGLLILGGICIVGLIAAALAYSYLIVRATDNSNATVKFLARALIQPSELAWYVYDRVFVHGLWSREGAVEGLFIDPIDASRNTSIQYLMTLALGENLARSIIESGSTYAGGFPEIYFELFGPVLAWPIILIAGCITAGLFLIILRAVLYGDFLSAFFAFYLLYGVYVMYIGGMLNFLMPLTYAAKFVALCTSIALERSWRHKNLRLVPWCLVAYSRG
jgi:hypothetical protein